MFLSFEKRLRKHINRTTAAETEMVSRTSNQQKNQKIFSNSLFTQTNPTTAEEHQQDNHHLSYFISFDRLLKQSSVVVDVDSDQTSTTTTRKKSATVYEDNCHHQQQHQKQHNLSLTPVALEQEPSGSSNCPTPSSSSTWSSTIIDFRSKLGDDPCSLRIKKTTRSLEQRPIPTNIEKSTLTSATGTNTTNDEYVEDDKLKQRQSTNQVHSNNQQHYSKHYSSCSSSFNIGKHPAKEYLPSCWFLDCEPQQSQQPKEKGEQEFDWENQNHLLNHRTSSNMNSQISSPPAQPQQQQQQSTAICQHHYNHQNTLSAFVNHHHHHHHHSHSHPLLLNSATTELHRSSSCTGPSSSSSTSPNKHRMLLCADGTTTVSSSSYNNTSKTPPHQQQVHNQLQQQQQQQERCENTDHLPTTSTLPSSVGNQQSAKTSNIIHNHHHHHNHQPQHLKLTSLAVGHSNTLPANSSLSSLMATLKSCEQQNHNSNNNIAMQHNRGYSSQNKLQNHQKQELRRQISLNHLDKVNSKSIAKGNNFSFNAKNESKVSLFQQKIRAILSPSSNLLSSSSSSSTKENNNSNIQNNVNSKSSLHQQQRNESTYRSYGNVSQSLDDEEDIGQLQQQQQLGDNNRRPITNINSTTNISELSSANYHHNGHDCPNERNISSMQHRWIASAMASTNDKIDSCLLNTLNKYTVSASSNNLSHLSSRSNNELESLTESDHYDLRTVCNKLFANNKQYPCFHNTPTPTTTSTDNSHHHHHSTSSIVSSMMQKSSSTSDTCYRNITPEMNIDKVTRKESLYSYANKSGTMVNNIGTNSANISQSSDNISSINPTYSTTNSNQEQSTLVVDENVASGHIVVVKELDSDQSKCLNGLTVRSQSPLPSRSNHTKPTQITNNHNRGSTLSLNGVEATESVESQDHNYKSSSESGRGTMNSHVEDRSSNNIDLNSPADLTSLDSDQSNHITSEWNNKQNDKCVRRTDSKSKQSGFSKIQRYLGDQRVNSNAQENDLNCNEFKSINEESDSWTSLSDDPTASKKKSASKSNANKIVPLAKHRYQPDNKLKTDFSKPENCMNGNAKQSKTLPTPVESVKSKLPANHHSHKFVDLKNSNTIPYDKCIYSVPDKGKYRNLNHHHYSNEVFHSKLNETNYEKDCDDVDDDDDDGDDGSISSETHFPDDGCSEYAEQSQSHHDPKLRKQLKGIEEMYSELLNMLQTKNDNNSKRIGSSSGRKKVCRRNSGRSSVASRSVREHIYKKYRHDYRNRSRSEDNSQIMARCKRLESQVLTLAKSVSQLSIDIQYNYSLSEHIQNLRQDMEMLKSQIVLMKQSLSHHHHKQQQQQNQQINGNLPQSCPPVVTSNTKTKESKKVNKLTRLFTDEPQPMKQFLKKLGYEKYLKNFESEKIGIAELLHFDEEKLQKLGIPMGPRIRIAQEIKNLTLLAQQQQQQQSTGGNKQQQNDKIHDNFNIYAVV